MKIMKKNRFKKGDNLKNRILLMLVFVVVMFAALAVGQDDAAVVVEAKELRQVKPAGYLMGINRKREITVGYVNIFVDDKVYKMKKALADNDFDRAFVLNSEIMLLIHKKRELLGGFYKKHKAVFLSQHELIVKAEKKHNSAIRRAAELERKKAVKQYLDNAKNLIKNAQYKDALVMIKKVLILDPENDEANMLETHLKDIIRWRKEPEVKQKILELELKAQKPKPCRGCAGPRYEDITYPDANDIQASKKNDSRKKHESTDRNPKNIEVNKRLDSKAGNKVK